MNLDRKQSGVLTSMVAAVIWTVLLVVFAPNIITSSGAPLEVVARWMCLPALTLLIPIAALAQMRFQDGRLIDGHDAEVGSSADRVQRILRNTTEQCVLAVLAWSSLAVQIAPEKLGIIPALAVSFLIGRATFAGGYGKGAPGRVFGFGLTFYPTVAATLWAVGLAAT